MSACKHIKVENLHIGDVIGTTSMSPVSYPIKIKTWGWKYAFDQSKANHIAVVTDEHTLHYFMEMLGKGIHETDIHDYDNNKPFQHICFVGRHKAFDNLAVKKIYNDYMLELHARHVQYGWDDIANYVLEDIGIRLHDKQDTLICSELPRVGYAKVDSVIGQRVFNYPTSWEVMCSPKDHQCWTDYDNITSTILV